MCQRIIIAIGLANSPSLILADEPTSGLDVTISVQFLDLMQELVRGSGSSLLLVSRDLGVIANYCDHVTVMYAGEVVESAGVREFFDCPIHPYSRRLIRAARASRNAADAEAVATRSWVPSTASGCRFAARCPIAIEACRTADIDLSGPADHPARCIRRDELLTGTIAA
jgi:oligopeptide/dipeptide ABC transporter ATP-binding protein